MSYIARLSTHTVITEPAANNEGDAPLSIRQIMIRGIISGEAKAITEKKIKTLHAGSAAAEKFGKHYSWYKGKLKNGTIKGGE